MNDNEIFSNKNPIIQLELLQADYEQTKKYDDPNYTPTVSQNEEIDSSQYQQLNSSAEEDQNSEDSQEKTQIEIEKPLIDTTPLLQLLAKKKEIKMSRLTNDQFEQIQVVMRKINIKPSNNIKAQITDEEIIRFAIELLGKSI